jgi:hypothetical protein
MPKRLAVAAVLSMCAFALGAEQVLYQIDLLPKGKLVSRDLPALKGTTYLFHQYPTGTLISVRKSTVKQITPMSPAAMAAASPTRIVPIRDLAFQGPKSSSSGGGAYTNINRARDAVAAANAGTAGRTASPD